MITVSDLNGKQDNYAWWLNIMPDEMPRLSSFELVNERSDYYGIPVLCTLEERGEPLTPTMWVTTLVERCEGNFLRSQAKSSKAA
jgi:hypothetical protein